MFGLFAGQPLIILGSTGPVYVFEKILYKICTDQTWDYLSLRLWIGIWVGLILLLLVLVDASAYVCYITRHGSLTQTTKGANLFFWIISVLSMQIHRRAFRHLDCFHLHLQCCS